MNDPLIRNIHRNEFNKTTDLHKALLNTGYRLHAGWKPLYGGAQFRASYYKVVEVKETPIPECQEKFPKHWIVREESDYKFDRRGGCMHKEYLGEYNVYTSRRLR